MSHALMPQFCEKNTDELKFSVNKLRRSLISDFREWASEKSRIVVITGANRGLGYATAKAMGECGATVVLTSRRLEDAALAVSRINNPLVKPLQIDITADRDVISALNYIENEYGRLDALINNAGVFLDDPRINKKLMIDWSAEDFLKTLDINLVGAFRLCAAFLPLMSREGYGRIVNVSSGMGRQIEATNDSLFYRTSKSALNMLTKVLSCQPIDSDILINAVCPGWIPTEMGGRDAVRDMTDGVASVFAAIVLKKGGFNGQLLRDGERFG